MPVPDYDDLADFFDELSEVATLNSNGRSLQIKGHFDEKPIDASMGASDFDAQSPRFFTLARDVEGVKRGDTLTIDAITYQIRALPKTDGNGFATIELVSDQDGEFRGSYV